MAVYRRGKLTVLRKNAQDRYERRLEKKLDDDYRGDVALAYGGDTVLIGREDGQIVAFDAASLPVRRRVHGRGQEPAAFRHGVAPGGKPSPSCSITVRCGSTTARRTSMTRPRITGQRDISCCLFPSASRAPGGRPHHASHRIRAARLAATRRYSPPLSLMERVYRYAILPLYTVFPKPGELDKTVQYLLSGKETVEVIEGGDLSTAQKELEPWRPVWSSLAFMVVVLTLGCFYLERQDF